MGERLGLLGGTFDPPHIGHLWLAETAVSQLKLDRVHFLPVGQPPHKQGRPISPVAHRLAMTQAAIGDHPRFLLDPTDAHRPPPHSTASLLPLLQQQHPAAKLWLLLGGDSLRDFASWIEPARVVAHARLGVLPRPGVIVDWAALETAVPTLRPATDMLAGPQLRLSSTALRHWLQNGRSVRYLTPPAVETYAQQHALYHHPQNQRG